MSRQYSLATDASGLLHSLQRFLSREEIQIVTGDYSAVGKLGGCNEFPVLRREDASFNPRPARVAKILVADSDTVSFVAVRAALWSTVPEDRLAGAPIELRQLVSSIKAGRFDHSPEARELTLALMLDEVRHLHMTELGEEEKAFSLQRADHALSSLRAVNHDTTLMRKLSYAISQQRKMLVVTREP